ncbi:MAG: AraC family ligand binding domain-containing protein [Planctomycetota bacterium]|nr:AraC family ligand binding domain-containing protein [Planctomycetota bacterium]
MQGTIFHTQPGLELNFTHEGRGTLWLAGRPIPLAPFRAVLFDARLPHQLVLDRAQPYRRSVLCVDPPRLRDLELDWILRGGPHRAILPKPAYARFDELLGMLHAEALGRARGWEDLTRALLVQLMVTLRRFVEAGVREDEAAPGDAGLAQLAAEYAARRLDQPLGLAEVARKFRVSPST